MCWCKCFELFASCEYNDISVKCLMELGYLSRWSSGWTYSYSLLPPRKILLSIHLSSKEAAASGKRRQGLEDFWVSFRVSLFLHQPFSFVAWSHSLEWCQCSFNQLAWWKNLAYCRIKSVINRYLEIKRELMLQHAMLHMLNWGKHILWVSLNRIICAPLNNLFTFSLLFLSYILSKFK